MSQCLHVYSLPPTYINSEFIANEVDMDDDGSDWLTETESMASATRTLFSAKATSTTFTSVDDDDASMRSPSPEPPVVFEMDESMRESLYKSEYGRNLNSYSEVYKLPADEEELERLGGFHSH